MPNSGPRDDLRDRFLALSDDLISKCGTRSLSFNIHDTEAAQAPSPMPAPQGESRHIGQVSVWLDCYQSRLDFESGMSGLGFPYSGYLVVESLYDTYGTTPYAESRYWPDGTRSPGVLTVAIVHRPEGLEYNEWIRRWHEVQSPVSGQLQPRTRYVRNEIVRPMTQSAPEINGIVEEGWPSAMHVSDPMLFFKAESKEELDANISRMMESVNSCLDLSRLRSTTMSEYLLQS
ncbi:MAG TPA: hypothetical protein VMU77_04990 [Acidimicrobiales bacterium]|nr:hypothetical protein [Acidimicrobiales bacterium]